MATTKKVAAKKVTKSVKAPKVAPSDLPADLPVDKVDTRPMTKKERMSWSRGFAK